MFKSSKEFPFKEVITSLPNEITGFEALAKEKSKSTELLVFPPSSSKGGVSISTNDYALLNDGELLNDIIIDFYLKWLHMYSVSEEDRKRTHIFSSYFYSCLTSKSVCLREDDLNLTEAQRRHSLVKSWTKDVDIFTKDFIFIPINELNSHWFLAVICFPSLNGIVFMDKHFTSSDITPSRVSESLNKVETLGLNIVAESAESTQEEEKHEKFGSQGYMETLKELGEKEYVKQPCILIFDSLPCAFRTRVPVMDILRDYLSVEYMLRKGEARAFTKNTMKGSCPTVPRQSNATNCGLFTLQYAESFFEHPLQDFRLPIRSLRKWFDHHEIVQKRQKIANLIHSLMSTEHHSTLPQLQFVSSKESPTFYTSQSQEEESQSYKQQNSVNLEEKKIVNSEILCSDLLPKEDMTGSFPNENLESQALPKQDMIDSFPDAIFVCEALMKEEVTSSLPNEIPQSQALPKEDAIGSLPNEILYSEALPKVVRKGDLQNKIVEVESKAVKRKIDNIGANTLTSKSVLRNRSREYEPKTKKRKTFKDKESLSRGSSRNSKTKIRRPCLYCQKDQTDLSKHLLRVHKNETAVRNIINVKDSAKRTKLLKQLRILGLHQENEKRFERGESPICLKKQKNDTKKSMCLNCKGIFYRKTIYLHKRNCYKKGEIQSYKQHEPMNPRKKKIVNSEILGSDLFPKEVMTGSFPNENLGSQAVPKQDMIDSFPDAIFVCEALMKEEVTSSLPNEIPQSQALPKEDAIGSLPNEILDSEALPKVVRKGDLQNKIVEVESKAVKRKIVNIGANTLTSKSVLRNRSREYEPKTKKRKTFKDKESLSRGSSRKSKTKIRRPCLYCQKDQTDLSKHLLRVHKNETAVRNIINVKDSAKRTKLLKQLRILGLHQENEKRFERGESPICLKKQKNDTKKSMCLNCKGIFYRKTIYLHKRNCYKKGEQPITGGFIPTEQLIRYSVKKDLSLHEDFNIKIMEKLKFDKVGIIIRKEPLIQVIGNDQFERVNGKKTDKQTRRKVLGHMRRVARIYSQVNVMQREEKQPEIPVMMMFDIEFYQSVKTAIHELNKFDGDLKAGGVKLYDCSMRKASTALISYFRENRLHKEKDRTSEFLAHYSQNSQKLVARSDFKNFSRRCILPRAENMPTESEVNKLKDFLLDEFKDLMNPLTVWDQNSFIRLRRAVVCRLTFFNGRCPVEVSELSIEEWMLAKGNAYITEEQNQNLNEEQKHLLQYFRIAYNMSKTYGKEVSILIPKSCFKAIDILANPAQRAAAGVFPSNLFLFPSTRMSKDPVSGYHDIEAVCKNANLTRNLCADKFRPRVSTAFVNLDASSEVKNLFFQHIGYNKEIGESLSYKMPKALRTILEVGPLLKEIDKRNYDLVCEMEDDFPDNMDESVREFSCTPVELSPNYNSRDKNSQKINGDEDGEIADHSFLRESNEVHSFSDQCSLLKPQSSEPTEARLKIQKLKQRNKIKWTQQDKTAMRTYFANFIKGSQKSYPASYQVEEFFVAFPNFLEEVPSPTNKSKKLRQQLYNFRKSSFSLAKKKLTGLIE